MPLRPDRSGLVAELHALAVADAQAGVGLSFEDWMAVIGVHDSEFSYGGADPFESAGEQLHGLAQMVLNADPAGNRDLANRIAALPRRQRIAILDSIDRYWLDEDDSLTPRETLEKIGVVFADSAHARLRAAAAR